MPPAFLLGAFLAADRWSPKPLLVDQTEVSIAALLIVLTPFPLWRSVTAIRSARRQGAVQSLRQPVWRPAFAVFVIASVNAGALLLLGPWPFTSQLLEVTRDGMGDLVQLAITLAFILSAIAGGTLMGIGTALIPGGNDRLVLVDLPLLHVHGILAYGAMTTAIILGLEMNRWAARITRWNRNQKQRAVDR